MNGKGDTQRPRSVTEEEWAERWKRIFRAVRDDRLTAAPHRAQQDRWMRGDDDPPEAA